MLPASAAQACTQGGYSLHDHSRVSFFPVVPFGTLTEEQKKKYTPQQLFLMVQEQTRNTTKFKKAALLAEYLVAKF